MNISVVMATYNGARFVELQLRSILLQLDAQDEIVVVDDASSDDTRARITALGDSRIAVHANPLNRGVLATFERALRLARHDVIFLADQDDVWLPDKRRTLCEALAAAPDATLALSDAQVIDDNGTITAASFMAIRDGFHGSLAATLLKNRYLGCAMAIRRALLDVALPFPADVPMHDMWLGAINTRVGEVVYIDRPLMQYRRHSGNVSPAQRQKLTQMLRWRWRLLKHVVARSFTAPRQQQSAH